MLTLLLVLVISDQLDLGDLFKQKNLKKQKAIENVNSWISKFGKEAVSQENDKTSDSGAIIDALMNEFENNEDELPSEWYESESDGPARVLRITKPSKELLQQIHVYNFDVWHLSRNSADVMVSYEQFQLIGDLIAELSPESTFQILVPDVDEMIEELGQSPLQQQFKSQSDEQHIAEFNPSKWFSDYHQYSEILELFDSWTELHEDVMEKVEMGLSYEKRSINAYHIKPYPEFTGERKKFYIQSLVHARYILLI
eukprot:NODE_172_length_14331_cov_0.709177.p9 type:complete len:255 gc:universal NODE_172_length_14331_cov_0.709177:4665-3901(-)